MDNTWRTCAVCKKPIAYDADYWVCSVSTCNSARFQPVFCKLACWDAHVPVMNHRNAWAEERTAPRRPSAGPESAEGPQRRLVRGAAPVAEEREVLIVASRLKKYIDDRSGGFNTSADVLDALSDLVRRACDDAIDAARADGRKTVKARDFRPPDA